MNASHTSLHRVIGIWTEVRRNADGKAWRNVHFRHANGDVTTICAHADDDAALDLRPGGMAVAQYGEQRPDGSDTDPAFVRRQAS